MQVLLEATATLLRGDASSEASSVRDRPTGSMPEDRPVKAMMFADEVIPSREERLKSGGVPKKAMQDEEGFAMDDEERDAINRRFFNRHGAGAYSTARYGKSYVMGYNTGFSARGSARMPHDPAALKERIAAQSARLKQEINTAREREKVARERARRAAQQAAKAQAARDAEAEKRREEARQAIAARRARQEEQAQARREAERLAKQQARRSQHEEWQHGPESSTHSFHHSAAHQHAQQKAHQHQNARSPFHPPTPPPPTAPASVSGHKLPPPMADETPIERVLRCGMANVHGALGVPRGISGSALQKAWKRASLDCHPDKNIGNEEAAERAQTIVNAAHDLLLEPSKLRQHEMSMAGAGASRTSPNTGRGRARRRPPPPQGWEERQRERRERERREWDRRHGREPSTQSPPPPHPKASARGRSARGNSARGHRV